MDPWTPVNGSEGVLPNLLTWSPLALFGLGDGSLASPLGIDPAALIADNQSLVGLDLPNVEHCGAHSKAAAGLNLNFEYYGLPVSIDAEELPVPGSAIPESARLPELVCKDTAFIGTSISICNAANLETVAPSEIENVGAAHQSTEELPDRPSVADTVRVSRKRPASKSSNGGLGQQQQQEAKSTSSTKRARKSLPGTKSPSLLPQRSAIPAGEYLVPCSLNTTTNNNNNNNNNISSPAKERMLLATGDVMNAVVPNGVEASDAPGAGGKKKTKKSKSTATGPKAPSQNSQEKKEKKPAPTGPDHVILADGTRMPLTSKDVYGMTKESFKRLKKEKPEHKDWIDYLRVRERNNIASVACRIRRREEENATEARCAELEEEVERLRLENAELRMRLAVVSEAASR